MWPCPYCFELHPVSTRSDHLTVRHHRFPCLHCDLISDTAEALARHVNELHRFTLEQRQQQEEDVPSDGCSVGPVMEVSGFIMEVLLTLRDIKERQNVHFRTLSEQIGALRGELDEVKKSVVDSRTVEVEVVRVEEGPKELPVDPAGAGMIYAEQWNAADYFPIKSVEQLKQLEEIARIAENHAHFKDLKLTLEAQNPDGWNPNGLVEFGKTVDKTFALKLFVTPEETPLHCVSLGDYKAFLEVLRESWKAAGPKRINRRLRHYLKLNRENIVTTNSDQQVNSTSDEDRTIVLNNGKRAISQEAQQDQSDVDFVVIKRRRGANTKLSNFKEQLKMCGLNVQQVNRKL